MFNGLELQIVFDNAKEQKTITVGRLNHVTFDLKRRCLSVLLLEITSE